MTTVAAGRVLTPTGWMAPGEVLIEGGLITAVRPADGSRTDRTLVPGFVDLQVNGHDDIDVATAAGPDWDRLDDLLVRQGVTTWCPTLVTAPLGSYPPAVARIAAAASQPGVRPAVAGVHLEGPFLGERPGAHPVELIRPVDLAWLGDLDPIVRLVTLAPEAGATAEAVALLNERGVLVSLGHSAASYEQSIAAIDAGARLVTHCFNAMAPLHHRTPGLLGAALTDDRVAVSVIADLAHAHPAAVRLAFRAKGASRTVLVTDAVAWRRGRVGDIDIRLVDGVPQLADGTIAGSALAMDRAVRNVVADCGIPMEDAVTAASTTPARLLGLDDRGAIEVGRRADLVVLGPDLEVVETWIGGERAF